MRRGHLRSWGELGAPALWGAEGFLLSLLASCVEGPSQDALFKPGSPPLGHILVLVQGFLGTGPHGRQ